MFRNIDDHFAKQPVSHFPRTRRTLNVTNRKTSQGHGLLTPFFVAPVFPGDTYQVKMAASCRMDTSSRVPLDEVYDDIYFFFVPYRIIDEDFPKILGERDDPYDSNTYEFPVINSRIPTEGTMLNYLPSYLGWGIAAAYDDSTEGSITYSEFNAYPIRAYWKIWNDFFRDENVDSAVDITSLKKKLVGGWGPTNPLLQLARVNKFHDYFTSSLISAVKGPEVYIPGAATAPVGIARDATTALGSSYNLQLRATDVPVDGFQQAKTTVGVGAQDVIADLSDSYGTIAQLTLAMQLYQLYDRRARFGTRYIETIRGQWGVEVPDGLLQRPEYLGGTQITLNNMPVLDTTSSGLGEFAGNSATTFAGASFTKSFVEYGMIIGLSVTRIKHTYGQGIDPTILGMRDELDVYNPLFANIGNIPIKNSEIYYVPGSAYNDEVFAYQEAWSRLRNIPDTFSGLFANIINVAPEDESHTAHWSVAASLELRTKFTYADYYDSLPSFGSSWLKEGVAELGRTLTGRLIPGSTEEDGHQFLFSYMVQPTITRILPAHSRPASLLNRL